MSDDGEVKSLVIDDQSPENHEYEKILEIEVPEIIVPEIIKPIPLEIEKPILTDIEQIAI